MLTSSLLVLSLNLAQASDTPASDLQSSAIARPAIHFDLGSPAPLFFAADPSSDATPLPTVAGFASEAGAVDMGRYYANMRTARIGLGLGIVSVPVVMAGAMTMFVGALGENEGVFVGGILLLFTGATAYVVGAPVMAAGAHGAASALHRGQVDVPTGAVIASWVLMGSGVAVSVVSSRIPALSGLGGSLFLGSYIASGVQMAMNGGFVPDQRMVFGIDPVNRGIRVGGRF